MVTFYATIDADSVRPYMPDVPILLPASSFARKGLRPPRLPARTTEVAVDCGGYVATLRWGDYRYTPDQYDAFCSGVAPAWAATMDYCCEPDLAALVRERQDRTTAMVHLFWSAFWDRPWAWVPTIQGWTVSDYRRHARDLAPLIAEMAAHYGRGSAFRVGIGTLCRRASVGMVRDVVGAVREELPDVPLHLWGVKLTLLQAGAPPGVVSVDSAAWNGLIKSDTYRWKAAMKRGLTQRQYAYLEAMPAYLAKVQAALDAPRTLPMFSWVGAA